MIPLSKLDFISKGQNKEQLEELPINVIQPQGPLFFGSIESLLNIYSTNSKHKLLILDLSFTTMIDLSGTYALEDLINHLKTKKIKVFTFCPNSKIQDVLKRLNFITHSGKNNFEDNATAHTLLKKVCKIDKIQGNLTKIRFSFFANNYK